MTSLLLINILSFSIFIVYQNLQHTKHWPAGIPNTVFISNSDILQVGESTLSWSPTTSWPTRSAKRTENMHRSSCASSSFWDSVFRGNRLYLGFWWARLDIGCTSTHAHLYTNTNACRCIHVTHMCTRTHTCMHACTHARMHAHTHRW